MRGVLSELTAAGSKAILFIDDIHGITGPNAQQGGGVMDASVLLKPLLARWAAHYKATTLLSHVCAAISLHIHDKTDDRSGLQESSGLSCTYGMRHMLLSCCLVSAKTTCLYLNSGVMLTLCRGEVRVVGCTSQDKYRKFIEKDPGLERRFQTVTVDAPGVHESLSILRGLRHK